MSGLRTGMEREMLYLDRGGQAAMVVILGMIGTLTADGGEQFKLGAFVGAAGEEFGSSVAISGSTAIVGVPFDNANGVFAGSAYLFDTNTGQVTFKIMPEDPFDNDFFGAAVAISGNLVVVGATGDDDNGLSSGSAYVFDITNGLQVHKLLPDDGASGDEFGISVGISGQTVLVGSWRDDDNGMTSGSAYLFDAGTGLQIDKLLPGDGAAGAFFGFSVGISVNAAAVGAFGDDENGAGSGAAYLFDVATGMETFKLLANDGANDDQLGIAVGIDGGVAIVGANLDDDNGGASGSAYLFSVATGQQTSKLTPDDGAASDIFGGSVSVSGTTALVGSYQDDDSGDSSGSAYLFDATNGLSMGKLLASDGAADDRFGIAVAIDGDTAIVGASRDDDSGAESGSAYQFGSLPCLAADLNNDGGVDAADLGIMLGVFGAKSAQADLNGDGDVDAADLGILLGAFGADCP